MTAAWRLNRARRSVALLEARDRVGGRTHTVTSDDGVWIDRGGAWIGPGQDRIYALMEEFGVPEYKQHNDSDAMLVVDGKKHRYGGKLPPTMSPWAVANLGLGLLTVERMCKTLPREAPWAAKDAAEWDRTSLGDWARAQRLVQAGTRRAGHGLGRPVHLGGRRSVSAVGAVADGVCGRAYLCHLRQGWRTGRPPGRWDGRDLPADGRGVE